MDIEAPTLPGGSPSSVGQLEAISNSSAATESGSATEMPSTAEKILPMDINREVQHPYPFFEPISPVKIPLTDDVPRSVDETSVIVQSQADPGTVDSSDEYAELEADTVLTHFLEDCHPEPQHATDDELWADLHEFLDDKKSHQKGQSTGNTVIEAYESGPSQPSDQSCDADSMETLELSSDNSQCQQPTTTGPVEVDSNADVPSEMKECSMREGQRDQEPAVSSTKNDAIIDMAPDSAESFTHDELQALSNLGQVTPISPVADTISEANATLDTECAINPEQRTSVTLIADSNESKSISITIQDIPSSNRKDPPKNQLVSLQTESNLIQFTSPILRSLIMKPTSKPVTVVDTTSSNGSAVLEREKEVVESVLTRALEAVKKSKARYFLENVRIIPKAVYTISSERQESPATINSSTTAASKGLGTVNSSHLASTQLRLPNSNQTSLNVSATTAPSAYNLKPAGYQSTSTHAPNNNGGASCPQNTFVRPPLNQHAGNYTGSPSYLQPSNGMARPSIQQPMTYRQRIAAMLKRPPRLPQGFSQNVPRDFPQQPIRMPVATGSHVPQPFYSQTQYGSHQAQYGSQQSPLVLTNEQYAPHPMVASTQQSYPVGIPNQQIAQPYRQGSSQHLYGPNHSNAEYQGLGNIHNGFQQQAQQHNRTVPTMSYPMQRFPQPQQMPMWQSSNMQTHHFPQNGMYQQQPSFEEAMMAGQSYKRRAEGEMAFQQLPKLRAVSAATFDSQRFANSPNVMTGTSNPVCQPGAAIFQNAL